MRQPVPYQSGSGVGREPAPTIPPQQKQQLHPLQPRLHPASTHSATRPAARSCVLPSKNCSGFQGTGRGSSCLAEARGAVCHVALSLNVPPACPPPQQADLAALQ